MKTRMKTSRKKIISLLLAILGLATLLSLMPEHSRTPTASGAKPEYPQALSREQTNDPDTTPSSLRHFTPGSPAADAQPRQAFQVRTHYQPNPNRHP